MYKRNLKNLLYYHHMRYDECKYLRCNESSKDFYLAIKLCNSYDLPIVSYTTAFRWHSDQMFFNYLPNFRLYKQRIINAAREGNIPLAEHYLRKIYEKTDENNSCYADSRSAIPSGWLKLIETFYQELIMFNEEFENARLEGEIRKM